MSTPTITLLTPVYNNAAMVGDFIQSVRQQTYPHWQLVLVNDGSNDESGEILDNAAANDARISVLHQTNAGQQQALLNALPLLSSHNNPQENWVMLAHADDLLNGPTALAEQLPLLQTPELDGLYAGFDTMDETGQPSGQLQVPPQVNEQTVRELFLNGGSNPIPDHFFCRQSVFTRQVVPQYLHWNTPYWLNLPLPGAPGARPGVLRLAKAERSWYRYRVYGGNYITRDQGRFVMSHGALRSTLALSRFYRRIFPLHWRKRPNGLKRFLGSTVLPMPTPHRERLGLLKQVLTAYYGKGFVPVNRYHTALLHYYSSCHPKGPQLKGPQPKGEEEYSGAPSAWLGKDVVAFYQALASGDALPPELDKALAQLETDPARLSASMRYFLNLF